MARARVRTEWQQTSSVLAFLAEPHRNPKKRSKPFKPADFDPTRGRRRLPKGRTVKLDAFVDEIMIMTEKIKGG
jgi:RecB family exonuclease